MMIYEGYEFMLKRTYATRSNWRCTRECFGCKVKVVTYGKNLVIKATTAHNHDPTFKGVYGALQSQIVNVQYSNVLYYSGRF